MEKVGFIGLGSMGAPMAAYLLAGGYKLYLHDVKNPPFSLIERGATVCTSPAEVARRAEIIMIMMPDTPRVEAVLFGDKGVEDGLMLGKTIVNMSPISPIATKEFAKRINKLHCDYLDAPVSGGEAGAKSASLTIMAGGPESAFNKVKPLFELMGKNITWSAAMETTRPSGALNRSLLHRCAQCRGRDGSIAVRFDSGCRSSQGAPEGDG